MKLVRVLLAAVAVVALAQPDPWGSADMVQPEVLAARLKTPSGALPKLLFVGFPSLYRNSHIPGAVEAGPDSKPAGLEALRSAVASMPRNAELLIYCGCCPLDHCPNLRPAYTELRHMGFTNVHVLSIPTNMSKDWISKGYPIERR